VTALLLSLWPALAVAFGLGIACGRMTGFPRSRTAFIAAALPILALTFVAGLAWVETVPGRAGLYLEIAALLLAGYVAGCLLGALVARLSGRGS
jgi:hypothetical protein